MSIIFAVPRSLLPAPAALLLAAAIAAVLAAGPSSASAVERRDAPHGHSRLGEYENMGDLPRRPRLPEGISLDDDGVPLVDYGTHKAYNPTSSAQYALYRFSLWIRYGDVRRIIEARRVGRWFVRTQRRDGTWPYRFDLTTPGVGTPLEDPWISALAQGQAISLLVRLHDATGERRFVRAAKRALRPFRRSVARGGVRTRFRGRLWFEEYPSTPPSLVLNGMLQSLLGLYDLSPRSTVARRLYREGRRSVIRLLPLFDEPGGLSLYNLAHLTAGTPPYRAAPAYHAFHVEILRIFDRLQPAAAFRRYADRWQALPRRRLPG